MKYTLKYLVGIGSLFLFITLFFLKSKIDNYNEMDVIPYAKGFYNDSWLASDWYVHLKIPYRFLFSYPVGYFTEIFGFYKTIYFGRLVSYFFFSITMFYFIKTIRYKHFYILSLIPPLAYFTFFDNGIGAGEWIIGGLDTKVFSYMTVLLSLTFFLRNKLKWSLAFAGLAISFHILIGFYHFCCLAIILVFELFNRRFFLKNIIKYFPFFLAFGIIGFYGIFHQLYITNTSLLGWKTYVNFRVPRHVLPNHFIVEYWIKFSLFSSLSLWFFIKTKNRYIKLTTLYTLVSVTISLIGLLVFIYFPIHFMKYYFFRFSDAILPLFTLMNIILFSIEKRRNFFNLNRKWVTYISLILIMVFIIPKSIQFTKSKKYAVKTFETNFKTDLKMINWVKNNTKKEAVFITPQENYLFYINYERPILVSYKHAPQQNNHLIEWKNRLQLLNKGNKLTTKKELLRNYYLLTKEEILGIKKEYPAINYLLTKKEIQLDFPIMYTSDYQNLYQL